MSVSVDKQPDGTYTITGLSREQLAAIAEASWDDELEVAVNDQLFAEKLVTRHIHGME